MEQKRQKGRIRRCVADILISIFLLSISTMVGMFIRSFRLSEANIIAIYILGVLLTAVWTTRQIYCLMISIASVLVFNFFFTEPQLTFNVYDPGHMFTFVIMFLVAIISSSLTVKLKDNARKSKQDAYRMKVLLDTNQILQQTKGMEEILAATAKQLVKLLGKNIIIYPMEEEGLGKPWIFAASTEKDEETLITDKEYEHATKAIWQKAFDETHTVSEAGCVYYVIHGGDTTYGVIGIAIGEDDQIGNFEKNILGSIFGECALALENERIAAEKEEAAIMAKNEQTRANLLRAISHDLRTPLTTISGNASNLLSNWETFEEDTFIQIFHDIYDDSMWLNNLVENLLSVTRLEEGQMNLHMTTELLDDVIREAIKHLSGYSGEYRISVELEDGFLLVNADARLLVQVIINIVDNAIKYTPKGSEIMIIGKQVGKEIVVSILDNGPGVPDEIKPKIFEMFYSGTSKIADSRRSLGLGLALCKTIITAHGGTISVMDGNPCGAVFTFTIPAGEVNIHE